MTPWSARRSARRGSQVRIQVKTLCCRDQGQQDHLNRESIARPLPRNCSWLRPPRIRCQHSLPMSRNSAGAVNRALAVVLSAQARASGSTAARHSGPRVASMLRPGSWSRPAGGSPVRVDTGVPGSRPRFAVEGWRAERGVKSLCGGSKHAGRSVKRTLQPRHDHNGGAGPLMSRRRPRPSGLVPVMACRVLPGYGGRHVCMVWAGTGETRLPGLRRAKARRISRW